MFLWGKNTDICRRSVSERGALAWRLLRAGPARVAMRLGAAPGAAGPSRLRQGAPGPAWLGRGAGAVGAALSAPRLSEGGGSSRGAPEVWERRDPPPPRFPQAPPDAAGPGSRAWAPCRGAVPTPQRRCQKRPAFRMMGSALRRRGSCFVAEPA